jgi:hypothetical protein
LHLLSSFTDDFGLRPESRGSALPRIPIIRFRWGDGFAASLVRCSLRPVELLAPLTDLTGHFRPATGTFTPELSASRSPFSSSGITTVATERFHRWDFHPLERQLASLHGLFHPLQHAGLSRRTPRIGLLGSWGTHFERPTIHRGAAKGAPEFSRVVSKKLTRSFSKLGSRESESQLLSSSN